MAFADWLVGFRALHEQSRKGKLSERERRDYVEGRDQLANALIVAQKLALDPGLPVRHSLRVARAMQIDLELDGGTQRALTLDISMAGFSAILGRTPEAGQAIGISLRMPDGTPLVGRARVVAARRQGASSRVSFAFVALSPEEAERLGDVVFDVALAQLRQG